MIGRALYKSHNNTFTVPSKYFLLLFKIEWYISYYYRIKQVTKMLIRKTPNLTQAAMAKELGIAKKTYASYEQEKRMPDSETQNHIADFFHVSLDYLYGREQKKTLAIS